MKIPREATIVFALGLEVAASVVGSIIVGILIDDQLSSTPFGLIAGAVVGSLVAVARLIRFAKVAERVSQDGDETPRDGTR